MTIAISEEPDSEKPPTKEKQDPLSKKEGTHGLCWEGTPSPAAFLEQAFEILSPCPYERLTVDAPEPSQAKAPQAMPVFGFSE